MPQLDQLDGKSNYNHLDIKPNNWNIMLEYAAQLSKPFKYVRVDFYEVDGTTFLSELTFLPNGGYIKHQSYDIDVYVGNMLKLT